MLCSCEDLSKSDEVKSGLFRYKCIGEWNSFIRGCWAIRCQSSRGRLVDSNTHNGPGTTVMIILALQDAIRFGQLISGRSPLRHSASGEVRVNDNPSHLPPILPALIWIPEINQVHFPSAMFADGAWG
nr:uncharacterized protein LOC109424098 [Aedes albopictus]